MSTTLRLAAVEAKLFLREPMALGFGVIFPTVLLLALGAIPVLREPSPDFDGARFVEFWAPTALVLGIGILGLQHIPGVLSTYREHGILRRLATTPVHPGKLLVAQLLVAFAAGTVAALLLIIVAWLLLDVPPPAHLPGFAIAFVVGFGSVLGLGLLIAALAPTSRVANGLATSAYLLVMFLSGVFLPRFLLPEFLTRIGDYTPPGVQAMLEAWTSDLAVVAATGGTSAGTPDPVKLGIMALIALVAGGLAARVFRWE